MQVDGCFGDHWPQANQSWILFRQGLDACAKHGGRKIVLSVESCDDPAGCGEWIGGLANKQIGDMAGANRRAPRRWPIQ